MTTTTTDLPTTSAELKPMITKTTATISAIDTQINTLQSHIEQQHARLDESATKLERSREHVKKLEDQVSSHQVKVEQAKIAVSAAKGSPAEKALGGSLKHLQAGLTEVERQHQEAVLQHSTLETASRVESENIAKEIASDEQDIATLEQSRRQWEQLREETTAALKLATQREYEEELAQKEARIKELKTELFDREFEYNSTRYAISVRFAQWPDLVREMNAKYGDKDKDKPVETPTMRVLKKYLALLEALRAAEFVVGTSTPPRPIQGAFMRDLIAIPAHIVDGLLRGNPQAQAWLESRILDIRDWWLKEHMEEARSGRYVG